MTNILIITEPGRAIPELAEGDIGALRTQFPTCDFHTFPLSGALDEAAQAALRREADWAEVIVGRIPPAYLKNAVHLKWHHLQSAGVNGYERKELYPAGAVLTRSADVFSIPIAEHVLAMLLGLNRRLPLLLRQQSEHIWQRRPVSYELCGATVLLLGAGSLAREILQRLAGFGCTVTSLRRDTSKPSPGYDKVYGPAEKLTAFAGADYIVNTLPLTAATKGYVGEAEFAAMKPRAVYLNVGRGGTTDTAALVRALQEGRIAGAGLDVTDPEPLPPDHPLWDMENVILTPHNSGDSLGSNARRNACFVENLRRYLAGEPLNYPVDFEAGY